MEEEGGALKVELGKCSLLRAEGTGGLIIFVMLVRFSSFASVVFAGNL